MRKKSRLFLLDICSCFSPLHAYFASKRSKHSHHSAGTDHCDRDVILCCGWQIAAIAWELPWKESKQRCKRIAPNSCSKQKIERKKKWCYSKCNDTKTIALNAHTHTQARSFRGNWLCHGSDCNHTAHNGRRLIQLVYSVANKNTIKSMSLSMKKRNHRNSHGSCRHQILTHAFTWTVCKRICAAQKWILAKAFGWRNAVCLTTTTPLMMLLRESHWIMNDHWIGAACIWFVHIAMRCESFQFKFNY